MSKNLLLAGLAALVIIGFLTFKYSQDYSRSNAQQALIQEYGEMQFQKWHEFNSPTAQFKVLFPTLPQHATDTIDDPKTKQSREYDMYVAEKDNGTIFMISIIKMMNKDVKIDENALTAVMDDILVANPQSKLKTMQVGTYQSHPALDFSIENDQVNIDGKAFLEGNTLYLLTSAAKLPNYHKNEFDFFVNSFQLLNLPVASEAKKDKIK